MKKFYVFNSGGNDSIAVLQEMVNLELPKKHEVTSIYTNTGWSAEYWPERMVRVAEWCRDRNIRHVEIATMGFEKLVLDGVAGTIRFPNGMRKTCTERLKIIPAQKWMSQEDPEALATCVTGVRRCESKRRAMTPVYEPSSLYHGGRALWKPLAEHDDDLRNALLIQAGFDVLPHRSDECEVCIHANRQDLRRISDRGVARVRALENATGKFMFRPAAYAGAEGIDEVLRWAHSERGQFRSQDKEREEMIKEDMEGGCDSDFCEQ